MLPLSASEPVRRFPRATLGTVIFFFAADLLARLWPGPHQDFLLQVAYRPAGPHRWTELFSWAFHPHLFSLLVTLLFVWAFTPRLFENRGFWYCAAVALSGALAAVGLFTWVHPGSSAPLLLPDAVLGAWLGLRMRQDPWATSHTLVVGWGWLRVFEVPNYVLLFFWFFYLLLSNLFLPAPFSDAPMLYLLPFAAFLWGFLVETLRAAFRSSNKSEGLA